MHQTVEPTAMGLAAIPPGQSSSAPVAVPQPQPEAPRQRHCLIVYDSRVVRKVSRRIVQGLSYAVTEAENGQEALGRCQLSMPDLVLLDWDISIMTGIGFIASFRAIRGNERAKAAFCTSKSGAHEIHRGISAGADEYVNKPFDEATLRAKLQAIGAI